MEHKNYDSSNVFYWVEHDGITVKKCKKCGGMRFTQKDKESPFVCVACGTINGYDWE